jgi:hypothetical protein
MTMIRLVALFRMTEYFMNLFVGDFSRDQKNKYYYSKDLKLPKLLLVL